MSNTVYPELDCKQLIEDHSSVVHKEINDRRVVNGEKILKDVCKTIAHHQVSKKTIFRIYFDGDFFENYGYLCGDESDYIYYIVGMLKHNLISKCDPPIVADLELLSDLSVLVVKLR